MPQHVDAIKAHPLFKDKSIDFKLAERSMAADGVVMHETGFDNLAVRLCKVQSTCLAHSVLQHSLQHSQFAQLVLLSGSSGMLKRRHSCPLVTQELVTLGPLAQGRADAATNAGEHLSPQQFHQLLQEAGDDGGSGKETVLIDARNIYETSIGHFEVVRHLRVAHF